MDVNKEEVKKFESEITADLTNTVIDLARKIITSNDQNLMSEPMCYVFSNMVWIRIKNQLSDKKLYELKLIPVRDAFRIFHENVSTYAVMLITNANVVELINKFDPTYQVVRALNIIASKITETNKMYKELTFISIDGYRIYSIIPCIMLMSAYKRGITSALMTKIGRQRVDYANLHAIFTQFKWSIIATEDQYLNTLYEDYTEPFKVHLHNEALGYARLIKA